MAAKPLEAIPEETVTPTTTERVTSDVSKQRQRQQNTLAVLLLAKD